MSGWTVRRLGWCAPALAALLLPAPSPCQRRQPISGMDADVDGAVSGVSLTLLPQLQAVSGEAYEWLEGRWRQELEVAVGFAEGYAVGVGVGLSRLREEQESGHAWATDFVLELLWERQVGELRLTAGPLAGYGRVSRPAYGESPHGLVAGAKGAVAWGALEHLELMLDVSGIWSSFNPLSFAVPAPVGYDPDAIGRRVLLGLGLGYRWS